MNRQLRQSLSGVAAAAVLACGTVANAADALGAADLNADGNLSLAEVQAVAPRLARRFPDVDKNGDGQLSAKELRDYRHAIFDRGRHTRQGTP
jgi:hypothetical protein